MKKKVILLWIAAALVALFILPGQTFAGDTTSAATGTGSSLPSWLPLVSGIVVGVYELLIRYIPTVKNYSILGWVITLIQAVIPNNNSAGVNHS